VCRPGQALGKPGSLVTFGGVNLLLGEANRAFQVRSPEVGALQVRPDEVGSLKPGVLQVCGQEDGALQVRSLKVGVL